MPSAPLEALLDVAGFDKANGLAGRRDPSTSVTFNPLSLTMR
jgi:hypothetical protein